MKILVIRTHRLGDILQVTPMIAGLKQACPESELWFLAGDRFKDVLVGNPNIDRIVSFPIGQWRWQLKNNRPERFKIFNELYALVNFLRNEQFDLIINRQYEFGAILSFLVGKCEVIGQSMGSNGAFFFPDQISKALYNYVKSDRRGNKKNLVDWSIDIARVHPPDRSLCLTTDVTHIIKTSGLLIENGVQPNDGLVGFQMGASKDFRKWGSDHFAVLAESILRNADRKIILFGADDERDLGRELIEHFPSHERRRIIDAIGQTSIKELGALLQRCSYLVTGDTGTMHVAAAVGTRVVAFFYGPAYPFETGPYGDGHLIVWPDMDCAPCTRPSDCRDEFRCLTAITPATMETAVGLMETALNGNKVKFSHSDLPKSLFWATEMGDEGVQLFSVNDQTSIDRFISLCGKFTIRPVNPLVHAASASKEILLRGLLQEAINTGNIIVEDFDRGEADAWAACADLFGVWKIIMDIINNSRIVLSKPAILNSVVGKLSGLPGVLLEMEKALQSRDVVVVCDLITWFMNPMSQSLLEPQ